MYINIPSMAHSYVYSWHSFKASKRWVNRFAIKFSLCNHLHVTGHGIRRKTTRHCFLHSCVWATPNLSQHKYARKHHRISMNIKYSIYNWITIFQNTSRKRQAIWSFWPHHRFGRIGDLTIPPATEFTVRNWFRVWRGSYDITTVEWMKNGYSNSTSYFFQGLSRGHVRVGFCECLGMTYRSLYEGCVVDFRFTTWSFVSLGCWKIHFLP